MTDATIHPGDVVQIADSHDTLAGALGVVVGVMRDGQVNVRIRVPDVCHFIEGIPADQLVRIGRSWTSAGTAG